MGVKNQVSELEASVRNLGFRIDLLQQEQVATERQLRELREAVWAVFRRGRNSPDLLEELMAKLEGL